MCQAPSPEAAKRGSSESQNASLGYVADSPPPSHWPLGPGAIPPTHDCSQDHISDWPNMTREFGDAERTIRLSFTRCSLAPTTLIIHTELDGHAYQRLSRTTGAPLPSFKSISRQGASLRDPQGEDVHQKPQRLRQTMITDFMTKQSESRTLQPQPRRDPRRPRIHLVGQTRPQRHGMLIGSITGCRVWVSSGQSCPDLQRSSPHATTDMDTYVDDIL
ncbi:hypothetical protein C8Q74DRAFT_407819 [Fomes fomentarius]|nr:hypothetical protein C8Q74DRAFT_407819 [Fomes fomentarius]